MSQRPLNLFAALFVVIASLPGNAPAEIISRDLRTAGDGLLTYDTASRREWLDVTKTAGRSPDQIRPQLEAGGEYFGFAIASPADVDALVTSAGYDRAFPNRGAQYAAAFRLLDFLGDTLRIDLYFQEYDGQVWPTPTPSFSWRIADAITTIGDPSGPFIPYVVNSSGTPSVAVFTASMTTTFVGTNFSYPPNFDFTVDRGIWLYRDASAPEPNSLPLTVMTITIGVAALHPRRR